MAKITIYVPEVIYTPYVFDDELGVKTPQDAVRRYEEGMGDSEPSFKWYECYDLMPQEFPWKIEIAETEKRARRIIDFDGHGYTPATTFGGCNLHPKPRKPRPKASKSA